MPKKIKILLTEEENRLVILALEKLLIQYRFLEFSKVDNLEILLKKLNEGHIAI